MKLNKTEVMESAPDLVSMVTRKSERTGIGSGFWVETGRGQGQPIIGGAGDLSGESLLLLLSV